MRAVERILDREPPSSAITHRRFDLLGQVADAEHHAIDAGAAQQVELVKNKRTAGDAQQRLGHPMREGMQPRGETARKYGDGQHDYDSTIFVPSKSKPNRTSSRPASAMACRSWRRSEAENIRKPPPPAPTS